jgi:Tfp pilus tip-associated adhesin PilY1
MEDIMLKKYTFLALIIFISFFISLSVYAQDEETGDEEIFVSVAPDALIVLDVTGSMDWNPIGTSYRYGSSSCAPDTANCANYSSGGTTYCSGGYCSSGTLSVRPNCNVNCSRMSIAKRAIFGILDDDGNGTVNTQDSNSLGVRIGLMTFGNNDTGLNYASGNIILRQPISALGSTGSGTPYQTTYCGAGKNGSCIISDTGTSSTVAGQTAAGGTPLTNALREAKIYLDAHKAADKLANECRKKFAILISDGADTYICGGSGAECQEHMYKRRRSVVAAAKQLNDAGYKLYVIGFGADMPDYLKNQLNWMAYYGGTDNPDVNSGSVTGYNIALGCNPEGTEAEKALCCNLATGTGACFPSGVTSCGDAATESAVCYAGGSGVLTGHFKAVENDPGYLELSGYAFMASNTDQLINALRTAIIEISGASYSFTESSVQTIRTVDETYLYEASFTPVLTPNNDSFWPGYLKRYTIINDAGEINPAEDWDAGAKLKSTSAGFRNIYTLKSGTVTAFNTTNISIADLGITGGTADQQEAQRQLIIKYIREGEQGGTYKDWKLGDIFHSSPITIGTPSAYFFDRIDQSTITGFEKFRDKYPRTTANGKRLIVAGTNNAQFHAFKAANDSDGGGTEVWSFVPPNFMTRLPSVAHGEAHPTSCTHQYFVDGATSAADVWWGTDQTNKGVDEWRTIMLVSLGRGGASNLWSSSSSCDTGLSNTFHATDSSHYCGYYAFDVTDTTRTMPSYQWKLGGSSGLSATHGSHLGQPWSKMSMGRVLYDGKEKWVGFIGGGFSKTDCSGGGACDPKGKGFYVIDISNGTILWSSTHSGPAGFVHADMDWGLAGQAATIDFDNDGFIDTAYIADMGGNVWRFKFCLGSETSCTWSGEILYDAKGNVRPIYTKPAVSRDPAGNVWVYFGTGDATDPTAPNAQERFHAVIDTKRTGTFTLSNLKSIDGVKTFFNPTTDMPKYDGWYMDMPGMGIKILSDPVLYYGVVSFTTYAPSNSNNLCEKTGNNELFGLDYITGAGLYKDSDGKTSTSMKLPDGPPVSVQGSIDDVTGNLVYYIGKTPYDPPRPPSGGRTNLLFWHDTRVQP